MWWSTNSGHRKHADDATNWLTGKFYSSGEETTSLTGHIHQEAGGVGGVIFIRIVVVLIKNDLALNHLFSVLIS